MNAYPSNYIVVRVNALSGLYLISTTVQMRDDICYTVDCVNALSGLYLISTNVYDYIAVTHYIEGVNALSGLYLISTYTHSGMVIQLWYNVSMPSRAYTSFLQNDNGEDVYYRFPCQCPLGLIPHFYSGFTRMVGEGERVSMPSRAYTSFLRW